MAFKSTLEAALADLKARGIIKSNKDILVPMGLTSGGTLSNYVKGAPPSKGFKDKFKDLYKIDLDNYKPSVETSEESNVNTNELDHIETLHMKAIINLTECNKDTTASIRELTEANTINARSIERLVYLLEYKLLGKTPEEFENLLRERNKKPAD